MWDKWTKFCEWNVQDAHDHPKKRAALIAANLVAVAGVMYGIKRYAEKEHEYDMRRRGVNV